MPIPPINNYYNEHKIAQVLLSKYAYRGRESFIFLMPEKYHGIAVVKWGIKKMSSFKNSNALEHLESKKDYCSLK